MTPPALQEAARKACWECGHSESETACEACVASAMERAVAERDREWEDAWTEGSLLPCSPGAPRVVTGLLKAEQSEAVLQKCEEIAAAIRKGPTE